jgi:hypothetical protein
MQVLVGLTHVGVMRSATWLLPNAPLLLDTLVAPQVCSVEALVRSCHAKASHFKFETKVHHLDTPTCLTTPSQLRSLIPKKAIAPTSYQTSQQLLSKRVCACNSQMKKLNAMLRNFLNCKLLNAQIILLRSLLTHCLNCALRNA